MNWQYGVTTCPERFNTLLPATLTSLEQAGFDKPRLFIDGEPPTIPPSYLEFTVRLPRIRAYGNWLLALWELYFRDVEADRFALFQDDIRCCQNLCEYLERCEYPEQGYLNLCTYPGNVDMAPEGLNGWYKSNQKGRGAQALVFSREAVTTLLGSPVLAKKLVEPHTRHRSIDGKISIAMRLSKWKEYVHMPSLVDHVGRDSVIGNHRQPQIETFLAKFNPLELLDKEKQCSA